MPDPRLPAGPPFTVRARVLTPLAAGGNRWEEDGLVGVDGAGRLSYVGPAAGHPDAASAVDVRPWLALPGLVDLHIHLPQLPNAGRGAGLDLLTWLERYTLPLERSWADEARGERAAHAAFRALAAAGTTTVLAYTAAYAGSTDAAFRAAHTHGIRAILGMVLVDRVADDGPASGLTPAADIERALGASVALCRRWHGVDDGRLGYAFTPRFAVACSADLLRESASAARSLGAYWQTHLAEDHAEVAKVARLHPDALDYVDVYDRAGGLGERTVLAHAIHLTDRELARLVDSRTRVAHCPSSNLFLTSGLMPLRRYLDAGLSVGLGSDVAAGPELSLFTVMRMGFAIQVALRAVGRQEAPPFDPLDWLRLGTLDGARALGLDGAVGSLERGKEADLILVDAALTQAPAPQPAGGPDRGDDPADLVSRLIFRTHPDMVRAAYVRGRLLATAPAPP